MKNQTVKFTCSTQDTLLVTIHKGKDSIKVSFKQRDGEGKKTSDGEPLYFELTDEAKATKQFEELVAQAEGAGWVKAKQQSRGGAKLKTIPPAPGAKTNSGSGSGQSNQMPRAASTQRR